MSKPPKGNERFTNAHEDEESETVNEIGFSKEAFASRELKTMAYRRLLNRAQHQMPPRERAISKFIHQPIIDAFSGVASQTLGRLSGLIGAGFTALLGTLAYYILARQEGYEYNFLIFPLLILIGYMLGLLVELLWRMFKALLNK